MVHLAMRMYCNWSIDHAIDHSSIGLNRLTIQLVFNEVSLFTFSKETHDFDVTVPKNYLKCMHAQCCKYLRRFSFLLTIFPEFSIIFFPIFPDRSKIFL